MCETKIREYIDIGHMLIRVSENETSVHVGSHCQFSVVRLSLSKVLK